MSRLLTRIIEYWALAGGALLILVVILTAINAAGFTANFIARIWGSGVSGLPGYEDAVTMLVGVAGLAIFPYCQLRRGHASVDIFMQKASKSLNRLVDIISNVLMVCIALGLGYYLVLGTLEARSDNVETAVLALPVWIFMCAAIPSCILWALAAFMQINPEHES